MITLTKILKLFPWPYNNKHIFIWNWMLIHKLLPGGLFEYSVYIYLNNYI